MHLCAPNCGSWNKQCLYVAIRESCSLSSVPYNTGKGYITVPPWNGPRIPISIFKIWNHIPLQKVVGISLNTCFKLGWKQGKFLWEMEMLMEPAQFTRQRQSIEVMKKGNSTHLRIYVGVYIQRYWQTYSNSKFRGKWNDMSRIPLYNLPFPKFQTTLHAWTTTVSESCVLRTNKHINFSLSDHPSILQKKFFLYSHTFSKRFPSLPSC